MITAYSRKATILEATAKESENVKKLTNTEDIKDFYEYTEECMKRISQMTTPSVEEIKHLQLELPFEEELKHKKLAIFDLDETLVHCEIKEPSKGQTLISVGLPSGGKAKVSIAFNS